MVNFAASKISRDGHSDIQTDRQTDQGTHPLIESHRQQLKIEEERKEREEEKKEGRKEKGIFIPE